MLQKILNKFTASESLKISRFDEGITAVAGVIKKPSRERQLEVLSQLVTVMGVLQAVATMPQVIKLYSTQDVAGLSLASWLYYSVFAFVLVVYGIVQGQRPLIIAYTANAIAYSSIAVGVIAFS